ncbi:MAG: hypothetical protein ACE5GV_01090 [Candidatus Scalindua sp.]
MYLWKNKFLATSLLLAGIVFCNQGMLKAEQKKPHNYEKGVARIVTKAGKTGTINWETRYITSKGIASVPSSSTTPSRRKLLARRGAIVDAQRSMLEIINGVRIDSATTVSDRMVNETIGAEVKGTLKNYEIIDEKWDGEVYEVTMQVPMGKIYKVFRNVKKSKLPDRKATRPKEHEYTGLVINARGLGLIPAIFVNIYNEDGRRIGGPIHPVYRVSTKETGYIKEKRIGTNPLRITAKGMAGTNGVDLVISERNVVNVRKMVFNTDIFSMNKVIILID